MLTGERADVLPGIEDYIVDKVQVDKITTSTNAALLFDEFRRCCRHYRH